MTATQFLVIIATIWIAPHANKNYGIMVGILVIGTATLIGLGVLK